MMRHTQRTVLNVAHDGGARRDVNVVADLYRRNQLRVASDHAAIADLRDVFVVAVVVDRDDAAADVGLAPDDGVAEVAQMACLGAATDARFFGLDEVADAVVAFEFGAGAQVGEGADFGLLADETLLGAHANFQMAAVANGHITEPGSALDHDARADPCAAEN